MTTKEKIERIDEYIVGLWKFRQSNKKPLWFATYIFNGYYYDVHGKKDLDETLDIVYKRINALKRGKSKKKK